MNSTNRESWQSHSDISTEDEASVYGNTMSDDDLRAAGVDRSVTERKLRLMMDEFNSITLPQLIDGRFIPGRTMQRAAFDNARLAVRSLANAQRNLLEKLETISQRIENQ